MTTEADDKPQPEDIESSDPQEQPERTEAGGPPRRSQEFKQELLARLPTLAAPKWQASETLNVYQELQGIVDLDADAFLLPLANIAEERHE
jgi:hypothetical protein